MMESWSLLNWPGMPPVSFHNKYHVPITVNMLTFVFCLRRLLPVQENFLIKFQVRIFIVLRLSSQYYTYSVLYINFFFPFGVQGVKMCAKEFNKAFEMYDQVSVQKAFLLTDQFDGTYFLNLWKTSEKKNKCLMFSFMLFFRMAMDIQMKMNLMHY